ncbi:MAG: aminoacyl-tRNA hydrolase [Bacteroidaceae bacterium]|nr:aminoacyl-tRNA hydrolase [Bacteroidaceae bacterium]
MKYLLVGLGNIGSEYDGTRHNIGFRVLDAFAEASNISFEDKRYGFVGRGRVKNAEVVLLKPSTYMNLSGNAVRYWMNEEKILPENLLIICDDIALPVGKIRLKASGSDGGHNGLKHISSVLCSQQFARLRFGVGNDFPRGGQCDFVLGQFDPSDAELLKERVSLACDAIKAFCLSGISFAMNNYNNK